MYTRDIKTRPKKDGKIEEVFEKKMILYVFHKTFAYAVCYWLLSIYFIISDVRVWKSDPKSHKYLKITITRDKCDIQMQ